MKLKNVALFKKDTTSEIFGAIGYLSEINFKKKKMMLLICSSQRC